MAGTYATLLAVYVDEFNSSWMQVLSTAPYKFRTPDSISQLTDALDVMAEFATQTDTLISAIDKGTVSGDDAKEDVASQSMLLEAKSMAIASLMNGVEVLDQDNLKKAASLDQPGLKTLAGNLKSGADATLLKNMNAFTAAAIKGMTAALEKNSGGDSDVSIYAKLAKDLANAAPATDTELLAWNDINSGAQALPGPTTPLTPPSVN